MRCNSLLLGSFVVLSALTTVACDDGGNTGGAGGTTSSSSTTSSKSSSGASMTTTGSSMTTSGSTTSSGSTSSASSSSSTGSGMMSMFDHLVITEVSVSPDGPEFFEIWNPTAQAIDLTNYYVSDNRDYWEVPAGMPWAPTTTNGGTDFLGGFPPGTMIGPDALITIAFRTGMTGFEATYNKCPNFYVTEAAVSCGGNMIPPLRQPVAGSIEEQGSQPVGLSNSREMLVLFTWDGNTANLVKDVDYVVWGDPTTDAGASVDKTGQLTYKADTACAGPPNPACSQKTATAPMNNQSIERCGMGEVNEKQTGGNGAAGSDETSEDLGAAFVVQATPTPGVKNACL